MEMNMGLDILIKGREFLCRKSKMFSWLFWTCHHLVQQDTYLCLRFEKLREPGRSRLFENNASSLLCMQPRKCAVYFPRWQEVEVVHGINYVTFSVREISRSIKSLNLKLWRFSMITKLGLNFMLPIITLMPVHVPVSSFLSKCYCPYRKIVDCAAVGALVCWAIKKFVRLLAMCACLDYFTRTILVFLLSSDISLNQWEQ